MAISTDTFSAESSNYARGTGVLRHLIASLEAAGKEVRMVSAAASEGSEFYFPLLTDAFMRHLPRPDLTRVQVLIVADLEHALPGIQRFFLDLAASPAAHRDSLTHLESVLFL